MLFLNGKKTLVIVSRGGHEQAVDFLGSITGNYQIAAVTEVLEHCPFDIDYHISWHEFSNSGIAAQTQKRAATPYNKDYTKVSWFSDGFEDIHYQVDCSRGGSCLYACLYGIELGYEKIIVIGSEMLDEGYTRFQEGWNRQSVLLSKYVRGLSGYPNLLLGYPTQDWINGFDTDWPTEYPLQDYISADNKPGVRYFNIMDSIRETE